MADENNQDDQKLDAALQFLKNLPPEAAGMAQNVPIAKAALALSQLQNPALDLAPQEALLAQISATAAQHAPLKHLGAPAQLAVLRDVLHLQFGFRDDTENYDDLQNCDMQAVLARRMGLPVALCILAIHIADALQLDVRGVAMPGHFLCALHHADGSLLFDPFEQSRALDDKQAIALLDRVGGHHQGLASLMPASRRDVLVRLANNRKTRLLRAERFDEALVVQESMLLLQPDQFTLWYEACLIAAEANNYHSALKYLEQAMLLTDEIGLIANLGALHKNIKGHLN